MLAMKKPPWGAEESLTCNTGTAIIFWGLIAGIIGMTFIYASLAECASMFPTAGGQYRTTERAAETLRPMLTMFYRLG